MPQYSFSAMMMIRHILDAFLLKQYLKYNYVDIHIIMLERKERAGRGRLWIWVERACTLHLVMHGAQMDGEKSPDVGEVLILKISWCKVLLQHSMSRVWHRD